jgi:hypothetical protein
MVPFVTQGGTVFMEEMLEQLLEECRPYTQLGNVATYIPELAKGDRNDLGVYVLRSDGKHYQAGDYKKRFTIQSVVKPILLLQALMDNGEEYVRSRVGVEATGKPFDAFDIVVAVGHTDMRHGGCDLQKSKFVHDRLFSPQGGKVQNHLLCLFHRGQ